MAIRRDIETLPSPPPWLGVLRNGEGFVRSLQANPPRSDALILLDS